MNILDQDLLFCDLETTGGNAKTDRITEIALVHVRDGIVVERYQQLVNPERNISRFITSITGINNEMVADKPVFSDVAEDVFVRLQDKKFIAHSANFDYRFLQRELTMAGYEFQTKPICTVKLSRALYPEYRKHNLDALIDRFDLTCVDRHRALDDTLVLWDLWQIFERHHGEKFFLALDKQAKKPKIELNICSKVLDTLPDNPGVYIMSDDERTLFIGSAKNLQDQVKKHFVNQEPKKRDFKIAREMTHIKTLNAVGPIDATIKMIEQKKHLRPRYNRKLNVGGIHWSFRLKRDRCGYLEPEFFSFIPEEEGIEVGSYGLFGTEAQAQKKFRHSLELIGILEKRDLNPLMYNIRVELALSSLKHHVWPHEAEFLVTETCNQRQTKIIHVFYNWCYLGSGTTDDEIMNICAENQQNFCPYLYPIIQNAV